VNAVPSADILVNNVGIWMPTNSARRECHEIWGMPFRRSAGRVIWIWNRSPRPRPRAATGLAVRGALSTPQRSSRGQRDRLSGEEIREATDGLLRLSRSTAVCAALDDGQFLQTKA